MNDTRIRVTVWNEYSDAQKDPGVAGIYPQGLHETIAGFLNQDSGITAKTAVLSDPEQGLSEDTLQHTDVLVWWGHREHHLVEDRIAARVIEQVLRGMGVIFLHSAHLSKPFKGLLGTSGRLSWREAGEKTRLWAVQPTHPIAEGVPVNFVIDHEEMYSEPFGIPEPRATVFISWFQGGNVFRSGVTFQRDNGKIFYFQPGHETYPTYHNEHVQRVITNAVKWAKPRIRLDIPSGTCPNDHSPLEQMNIK